ncbi:KAP family P-loop NTPase fold protein [Phyllobacterium chamaecytisi]|uniref:KAP family P-loop NTPase fold protein n=1 Tax=Phyllobacterium chamaecytisi TaxID=2876082 RepID=UPI001CCB4A78|nr:P-loop NTPase fold protein [Phyllobacterium sp. KW56]MBZ9601887.1 KAP family NTPase [Phyllobacterium sp. KW56]
MSNYFNDSPIENPDDDRYGITPFAEAIAKSILNIEKPIGTTIALNGPWGAGKSSAVNLIRRKLKENQNDKLVITDFKCWWYRGDEALALAFLQNLHTVLKNSLGDKVKNLIPNITQRVLQAGPVIGQAVSLASGQAWAASLIPGTSNFLATFFPKGETVETTFRKLAKILEEENRRFLIIIDDIDRLSPEEALAVFRLLKSVGHLPNLIYLLVFDRELADKAVQERYPSEGPHFLEKIIQAGFDLPAPLQVDLNQAVLASVQEVCGAPQESQLRRFMNVFYDVVAPYMTTPRHIARFQNAISVTWPAIADEVDLADFIALETLRLYEPGMFKVIRLEKQNICGTRQQDDPDHRDETRFAKLLQNVPDSRRETVQIALQRIFPRLEAVGYSGDWASQWDMERRICVDTHFDTYFRLSLSEEALSSSQINNLIQNADDTKFIKDTFKRAALTARRGDKSMVPIYLDELTTHARRVDTSKVELMLQALFEVHDEIDLKKDAGTGFGELANATMQFHWLIRRLTEKRFTILERTDVYLSALRTASLGWLVDFVSSAISDYRPTDGVTIREEDCLVTEEALASLKTKALDAIRTAAGNGELIQHKDLLFILYRWRDFCDDNAAEVRSWTDGQLENDNALVALAGSMSSRSWSMGIGGFGGLGDRVSMASTIVQIKRDIDILDPVTFRAGLERIRKENALDKCSLETVAIFLDAWDQKNRVERV